MMKLRHNGSVEAGNSRGLAATRAADALRHRGGVQMTTTSVVYGGLPIGTPDALDHLRRPRIE